MKTPLHKYYLSILFIPLAMAYSGCSTKSASSTAQVPSQNNALNAISPNSGAAHNEKPLLLDYFNEVNSPAQLPDEKPNAVSESISKKIPAHTTDAPEKQTNDNKPAASSQSDDVNDSKTENVWTLQYWLQDSFDAYDKREPDSQSNTEKLNSMPVIGK